MDISLLYNKVNAFILLLILSCPYTIIQKPIDFASLNLIQTTNTASTDFGRIKFNAPASVLKPQTPKDIAFLLSFLSISSFPQVSVSARGAGHSIHGQAQALDGIVIEMSSLPRDIKVNKNVKMERGLMISYVDVSGGALWIDVLKESLKFGLAPRSWTDYLYLTIGGTLSNGGISGQTFKYGPQIANVLQLDVVTGKGEMVTCSPTKSSELFYAVLGGLGQFGIITRARILLQDAPEKVRWQRAFYDDFDTFTEDQEILISMPELIDYVEGFVVLNEHSLKSSSVAFPANLNFNPKFVLNGRFKVYYCIEFAIHDNQAEGIKVEKVVEEFAQKLSYMQSHLYSVEISYFDFLNRVSMEEQSLRNRGLWEVPHPWLNLFVPRSGIKKFMDLLMENISPNEFEGPILVYPLLSDKWNTNASVALPQAIESRTDRVMYVVGMLRSINPTVCESDCLNKILRKHRYIALTATGPHIGAKQYLAHHPSPVDWHSHFGSKWIRFAERKARFDPLHILGPGQGIFS
ncbi:cytokinin dehydrogenase 3-like protein [Carex littledalei]|uniref:cytokinin dehydrogenase n=1 Tax=Carex littledalei TaxID=544730 RepID=A0A833VF51_9POAL|nr:cytokinin dehydrogenase 3-like protein [Carex littledalei]